MRELTEIAERLRTEFIAVLDEPLPARILVALAKAEEAEFKSQPKDASWQSLVGSSLPVR